MRALVDARAPSEPTLWLGNLDAELSWERSRLGSHAQLPSDVARALAAAASTMLVLARPGDRLWLPARFDADRLGPLLRGTGAELVCDATLGEVSETAVFPWGWTAAVEERFGVTPPCPIELFAELNDRRTSLAIEHELGIAVAGCAVLDSEDALRDALARWPHPAPWVLKAPLSASGRSRLRRRGVPEADALTRARRLLDRFGTLVLEPWLPREADFGTVGWIDDSGPRLSAPHRLIVDGNGVFRAAALDARAPAGISEVAHEVAGILADRGLRGPFGIDSFTYAGPEGTLARPLCEINARLSFGHLVHAVAERFGDELDLDPGSAIELGIARGSATPADAVILVNAGPDDPTTVYARCRRPSAA